MTPADMLKRLDARRAARACACGAPTLARGYCSTCYKRALKAGTIRVRVPQTCAQCSVSAYAKGFCRRHYKASRRVLRQSRADREMDSKALAMGLEWPQYPADPWAQGLNYDPTGGL